jgi:predicted anti-sigma-YlaC factor YlaD
MLGGLAALVAGEVRGIVRRNVTVLVLCLVAGLLAVAAAGYALNALHTVLALHYGAVAASLSIAGGLLVASLLVLGIALYVKSRPRPDRRLAAAVAAAPVAAKLAGSSRIGWRAGLVGGVVLLGLLLGRQFVQGEEKTK